MPCKICGGLHFVVNERGEDGYYLSVFNHSGVVRTVESGEKILPDATTTITVQLNDGKVLTRLEGSESVEFKDGKYYITINGGDWFFGKF